MLTDLDWCCWLPHFFTFSPRPSHTLYNYGQLQEHPHTSCLPRERKTKPEKSLKAILRTVIFMLCGLLTRPKGRDTGMEAASWSLVWDGKMADNRWQKRSSKFAPKMPLQGLFSAFIYWAASSWRPTLERPSYPGRQWERSEKSIRSTLC